MTQYLKVVKRKGSSELLMQQNHDSQVKLSFLLSQEGEPRGLAACKLVLQGFPSVRSQSQTEGWSKEIM